MIPLNESLITELAAKYGTPLYIFEEKSIRSQCQALKAAVTYPHTTFRYACKALSIGSILQIIREEGLMIDASSYNEVLRCLRAGFTPYEIVYTGEGADNTEFNSMLALGVRINCSSLDQLELVGKIQKGAKVSVRFNPGEGHGHHDKVNTGGPHSKHGIYFDQLQATLDLAKKSEITIKGVHTHIGSGTDLAHWLKIKDITLDIARQIPELECVDLGGGLPVVYNPAVDKPMPIAEWGKSLSESMQQFSKDMGREIGLELEPGRFIVAQSGTLLAEIQGFKKTPKHNFVIVNCGFNHNPRPVMYGAYHPIHFISQGNMPQDAQDYVVAGNLCESGDVFTVDESGGLKPRKFQQLQLGDLMVMGVVGAYSHPMMSEFNSMNLPASVLIKPDGRHILIERRGTFDDLLRREVAV